MGAITGEHVEWAVVDRMRQMLAEAEQAQFTVTQSYALLCTTLCWVMQRVCVGQAQTPADQRAAGLYQELKDMPASAAPWLVQTVAAGQIAKLAGVAGVVPPPVNFDAHNAARFLKNLRDAMAHGDARNVRPFNAGETLVGFTFRCEERNGWRGQVTLLRSDMQRIGIGLAQLYCHALAQKEDPAQLDYFQMQASQVEELAA